MAEKEVIYKVKVLDMASGKMKELELTMKRAGKAAEQADGSTQKLGGSLGRLVKGGAIATGVAMIGRAIYNQGKAAVSAAAQVERYTATLETMLGSKSAARERMQEYMDIAKYTPFELTQVVEAGNQLQALGRYSEDTLKMLGDLAAASGKPLEQVMNAYAKMASGQKGIAVDMFRDLLITTNDWAKATGKGVKASGEMEASAEELIASLPKILKSKGFFGLMARQAETTEGKISNLNDAVFSLRSAIGERLQPAVNSMTGVMSGWVATMEEAVRIPTEDKIAKEQAQLNMLVSRLIDANGKEKERSAIMAELKREYPEFLRKIDAEKASTEELRKALADTNREYDRKIRLAVYAKKMEDLQEEAAEEMSTIADVEIARAAEQRKKRLVGELEKITGEQYWQAIQKDKNGYFRKDNGRIIYYNDRNQSQIETLAAQIRAQDELINKGRKWYGGEKNAEAARAKLENTKAKMDAYREAMEQEGGGEATTESMPESGGGSSGGQTVTASRSNGSGVTLGTRGGGTGGGRVTNIGTLVGKLEIHTTTLKQGAAEIKALMTQILTEVVNDA